MGLDGLSLNNLGLNRNTSKEESIEADRKADQVLSGDNSIDQLGKRSEIQGGDHENPSASGGFSENLTEDEGDVYENAEDVEEEIYDEYIFEMIDGESIQVIDGETNKTVSIIEASDLSKFVSNLKQVSGIIVNKKV